MISFRCACGKSVRVDDRFAGKVGRCPYCKEKVQIPGLDGAPAKAPAPPAKGNGDRPPMAGLGAVSQQGGRASAGRTPPPPPVSSDFGSGAESDMYGFADPAEPVVNPAPMRPRPKPQKSPAEMYSDTPALGIITGCLLLANLIIPWFVGEKGAVMSWQAVGATPLAPTFYTWWACGLLAIVLASALKGLPRQISCLALGGICIIMLMAGLTAVQRELGRAGMPIVEGSARGSYGNTGMALPLMLGMIACVVLSHVRLMAPQRLWVIVVQSVCGGLAAVFSVIDLVTRIGLLSHLPTGVASSLGFDIVFMLLTGTAMAVGFGLVIFDAFGANREAPRMTKVSLALVYSSLGALALYLLFRPVAATGSCILLLPTLHMLAVAGSILFLLGGGLVGVIVHLLWKRELAK